MEPLKSNCFNFSQQKISAFLLDNIGALLKGVLFGLIWTWVASNTLAASVDVDIPPDLARWQAWVLHDKEQQRCPAHYNNGEAYQCRWPSRLKLTINAQSGQFEHEWRVFAKGWAPLPGGPAMWPTDVQLNGAPVVVTDHLTVPSVYIQPGEHTIRGAFQWSRMPEMIHIPPATGLVALTINGREVDTKVLDKEGRLWLQRRKAAKTQTDHQRVRIYRRLNDTIPMQVTHLVQLDIAGQSREITLQDVLLPDAIPMRLQSPLPARIGPGGALMVQARPGRWPIRIVTRFEGPIKMIGPIKGAYGDEIWSYEAQPHLRMVNLKGAPSVEPEQTDMPKQWKKWPAYLIKPDTSLEINQLRRGDPDPVPDRLTLHRTWWLDFSGDGFTIRDQITGAMSRHWYLAMNPPSVPGRIAVDGADRLITAHGKARKPGIELRRGTLNLTAVSRLATSDFRIPAVSWDHDFQNVSGVLNLPPGWRLFAASGVDLAQGAWFQRWTLLDLFLVLIISITVWKLRGFPWGVLALITLLLIFHEHGAPRLVWLSLLAALALLAVLPEGRIKKMTALWGLGSAVVLLVLAIPFMVQQVRWGVYPQLERTVSARPMQAPSEQLMTTAKKNVQQMDRVASQSYLSSYKPAEPKDKGDAFKQQRQQAVLAHDPNALIQTGPGMPTWQWYTYNLKWNGPVDKAWQIRLWLLSPTINLILAFLRVVLLALLIFILIDLRYWRARIMPAASAILVGSLILAGSSGVRAQAAVETPLKPIQSSAADNPALATSATFPPPHLLLELQQRLLQKPDCLPDCADFARMELNTTSASLQLKLQVHAACETVAPLPGSAASWLPEAVFCDQLPAPALYKDAEGVLWALVPQGLHTLTLIGNITAKDALQIPFKLKPHHVTVTGDSWRVQGVRPSGQVEGAIRLSRIKEEGGAITGLKSDMLQPFMEITRILHLGLTWQISTHIKRLTPLGPPIVASMPLIAGESVTSAGVQVENGQVVINMEADDAEFHFNSALRESEEIQMVAPQAAPWTEVWILDASPIWHCELSGIPVIHHQDQESQWKPQWRPWPGESVLIKITRPKALPGQMVTIDQASLTFIPGQRFNKTKLTLIIRTSKGGRHTVALPPNAALQLVKINNKSQPIRQEGQNVAVPLNPGKQTILMEWRRLATASFVLTGPLVKIGEKAVNAKVNFQMPRNRWILWANGPRMGPAVLFWSYLLVVVLAAIALGKIKITPLKTYHWLLLGLGLTQLAPLSAIIIVGWLLALGVRRYYSITEHRLVFNSVQLLLGAWTLSALVGLYMAIERGLLGIPAMQIAGNHSSDFYLHWSQDRIEAFMPQPWVVSLPLLVYHLLMLFWALWLAMALLRWLRWGWECYNSDGLWQRAPLKWKQVRVDKKRDAVHGKESKPRQPLKNKGK